MATLVDYGAVLDSSRHFSGNNGRGHIPGYLGHTPQLKYSFGKTYGHQTHDLRTPRYDNSMTPWSARSGNTSAAAPDISMPNTSRAATGDTSRYTRDMIPGYTGYIPRWPFKFGSSFKRECDDCLDEFGTMQYQKQLDTARMMKTKQQLQHPLMDESQVIDHLNNLHRTNNSKKADTDPPIPGYQGFIPRVHVSDVGLGQRFHAMAKSGYEALYSARS